MPIWGSKCKEDDIDISMFLKTNFWVAEKGQPIIGVFENVSPIIWGPKKLD